MRDDLKVCNCATCGQLLVASQTWGKLSNDERGKLSWIGGRLNGRPYCPTCFRVKQPQARPSIGDTRVRESAPNREME